MDSILDDKERKRKHVDFHIRVPTYHARPRCLATLLCGSAFLKNILAFLQELDEVGMTLAAWQRGNFHCELIQHPGTS